MTSQRSSECPRAARGIALLRHEYSQVAAAFAETCPVANNRRGGFVRPQKKPRPMPSENPRVRTATHVESSFNESQQAYVGLCIAGLNKLARGEVLGATDAAPLPLGERIRSRFVGDTALHGQFSRSLLSSTAAVFEDFGALYPNLTPALDAMYRGGAIVDGTVLAMADVHSIYMGMLGGVSPIYDRLGPDATGDFFTGRPSVYSPTSHEIWCPGEAFAKTIVRQGAQAAAALVQAPEVTRARLETARAENSSISIEQMRTTITASIERVVL